MYLLIFILFIYNDYIFFKLFVYFNVFQNCNMCFTCNGKIVCWEYLVSNLIVMSTFLDSLVPILPFLLSGNSWVIIGRCFVVVINKIRLLLLIIALFPSRRKRCLDIRRRRSAHFDGGLRLNPQKLRHVSHGRNPFCFQHCSIKKTGEI